MNNQNLPSVGLIGCGRWGANIARTLGNLGALRVIGDPNSAGVRPLADELGAELVATPEAVIARADLDAVAIAAPAVDHARLTIQALEAGKHVFVEKPLALTIKDAEACAAAATRAGKILMVGHLLQYHPAFVRMLELIAEGAIGDIRHVTSHRLNPGAIRTEENALWSLAPHDFSMILRLMGGQPSELTTLATAIVQPDIPDQYLVSMRFGPTRTAQVYASWISPYKEHRLTVVGEAGALILEDTAPDPARKLVLYRDHVEWKGDAPAYRKSGGEAVEFSSQQPLNAELSWFLDSIRGAHETKTGPSEAIAVLELLRRADDAGSRGLGAGGS